MAGIAWDKIIGAAAQSTLGILSLGILLVGVLAYLFFGKSDDRVKLWVFGGIMLAVVGLGIAILRESRGEGAPPAASPTASPIEPSGPAEAEASPAASTPATTANADVSGLWKDTDGFTYRFTTSGRRVSYTQFKGAEGTAPAAGSGSGTIAGRALHYGYIDNTTGDRGQCSGQLSADGNAIEGRCTSGGSSWGFRIDRAT